MKEEIDVLIPIFNSNRDYLCASIDSIHNQTIKNNIKPYIFGYGLNVSDRMSFYYEDNLINRNKEPHTIVRG